MTELSPLLSFNAPCFLVPRIGLLQSCFKCGLQSTAPHQTELIKNGMHFLYTSHITDGTCELISAHHTQAVLD
ncbi:hypothetical protein CapIbe_001016 [Capra ibex]